MKTPKQYAELLAPVDGLGFYSVDIRAEDVEDLVAAAQAEALEAVLVRLVQNRIEDPIEYDMDSGWNAALSTTEKHVRILLRMVNPGPDVTKQSDS